jgi:hypothetical protein
VGDVRLQVHVDELVLHGFSPHDRYAVGDGVQAELARVLTAERFDARPRTVERIDAGPVQVDPDPGSVGKEVGRAVARSLAP